MLKICKKYPSGKIEFTSHKENALMISSGRNMNDKIIKLLNKNTDIIFIISWGNNCPPSPVCIPSTVVAHNHVLFISWIVYLSSPIQTHTCIFFKIQYPSVFRIGIRNSLLTPHPVVWVFIKPIVHKPCLSSVIIIFNIPSRICIFGLSYPSLPIYPLQLTWTH